MATKFAPTMAHTNDPMFDATRRAAAKAGMTVDAWIEYTDKLARGERHLRRIDRGMREIPRYQGAVA